ncbi:MAG: ABC transporter ATP-binding protein [Proteobacteria bacterium]|nr:ABC transporter ATP-binding protein [Pseudomonadota bacterium]
MNGFTVQDLSVEYETDSGVIPAVDHVSFRVRAGARLGIIGESGSGKTTTALALLGMIDRPGRVTGGQAILDGTDLLTLSESAMTRVRLRMVSYIPQGAMNALNPVKRVSDQIRDGMVDHGERLTTRAYEQRIGNLLDGVGLTADVGRLFPHELSGGMKQRACIAIAISLNPKFLIADEPTSALDVVTQRLIMQTLRDVQEKCGAGLILIGHDMGLMAQFADELIVMRYGRAVEQGPVRRVFKAPEHAYTRNLIESVPTLAARGAAPSRPVEPLVIEARQPLLRLERVGKVFVRGAFGRARNVALHPISLTLDGTVSRIVTIVGQSGSGKSTLAGLMLGLLRPTTGRVLFDGVDVGGLCRDDRLRFRREVQAVFQDPYASYNPFYRVEHSLKITLRKLSLARDRAEWQRTIEQACRGVGLDPAHTLGRYAHELSGGQRQRLMVGRATMLTPRLLIADEPVSMVDASLRSTILGSLSNLRASQSTSIVYITHDLATAYAISDYVLVLHRGRVVEAGDPELVIRDPQHPYTQLLVDSVPWPDPDMSWASGQSIAEHMAALGQVEEDRPPLIRSKIAGFAFEQTHGELGAVAGATDREPADD